jgi:tetratricopeptide (TPR) repeat protein
MATDSKSLATQGRWFARQSRADWWLYLVLFLVTCTVYAPVRRFDFVNYDDPEYVTRNIHVRGGITAAGALWALTSRDASNWFPLTWLSHMLDCQLFGLGSGWHHLTNVWLHALAALLLFAFLHRATQARWRSALVALWFALHPLHVESVAWVAERKDVLSACFWFLTLWAYVRYTERLAPRRYLLVLISFCCGLMAKPMIVTLPLVLLLLDIWPLRRIGNRGGASNGALFREKLPFLALSAAAAIVTYLAQQGSGAVKTLNAVPLELRTGNALVSYAVYILKTIWPTRLAVFYPYASRLAAWQVAIAAVCVVAVSALVLRFWRGRPYLAVGWLWYLVTLAPVIGLVQVGAQARADRYMYVPMVGLSILLAWGLEDIVRRWPGAKPAVVVLMAAACASSAVVDRIQLQYWRNSESLFRHALEVTEANYVAHHNLGNALSDIPGRLPEAIGHLEAALRLRPDSAEAHSDLGTALAKIPGRLPEAIAEYETAVRLAPNWEVPHNNLGYALAETPSRLLEAIAEYRTAIRIKPSYAEAYNNLGSALLEMPGRLPEAVAQFQAALRLEPDYAQAHNNLGLAWSRVPGRMADAEAEFETALRFQPDLAGAHNNLANTLAEMPGRLPDAIAAYEAALRLQPDFAQAHYNLGRALARMTGRTPEAIAQFQAALRLQPDYAEAHNSLGVALAGMPGRSLEAIAQFEQAVRLQPGSAEAHYNLGVTLAKIPGRLPEALAQLDAALRLRPDPKLQRIVERIRTGRK